MSIINRLKGLMGMISCEEALLQVHEFLDGELEAGAESNVEKHFQMCKKCYPHLKLETAFREAIRRAGDGEGAPPDLKAKVAVAIAEAEPDE